MLSSSEPKALHLLELEKAPRTALLPLQLTCRGLADGIARRLTPACVVPIALSTVLLVVRQESLPILSEQWVDLDVMQLDHDACVAGKACCLADVRPASRAQAAASRSMPFSSS